MTTTAQFEGSPSRRYYAGGDLARIRTIDDLRARMCSKRVLTQSTMSNDLIEEVAQVPGLAVGPNFTSLVPTRSGTRWSIAPAPPTAKRWS